MLFSVAVPLAGKRRQQNGESPELLGCCHRRCAAPENTPTRRDQEVGEERLPENKLQVAGLQKLKRRWLPVQLFSAAGRYREGGGVGRSFPVVVFPSAVADGGLGLFVCGRLNEEEED